MHIDSPKFYNELKFIYYNFFPSLKVNSVIVFQDYFYHWSATLVASIQYLIKLKNIIIMNTAASSLTVSLNKPINIEELKRLETKMKDLDFVLKMLDEAILATNNYSIDRPHIFVPRLLLAKFQILWENQYFEKATNLLFSYVRKHKIHDNVFYDFFDLMKEGISMRDKYEKDYLS